MPVTLPWDALRNAGDLPSPALLIDEARMEANLAAMLRVAGDPARLRPHLKTHKLPQLVRRQAQLGITKAKVATVAEAEMAAAAGARDILLALQPVGPASTRLARLAHHFHDVRFSAVFDAPEPVRTLAAAVAGVGAPPVGAWIDLDIGQHRTGVAPGPAAVDVACEILRHPGLSWRGLHAYDGHLGIPDLGERTRACDEAFASVEALSQAFRERHIAVPAIVAGGSPTFAIHARRPHVELSPGTTVFWDAGYATKLPDLPFAPAVVLLARVVSRPAPGLVCLDLGHKAVAAEMPQPRVVFPALPDAEPVSHSEEHLVLRTSHADRLPPGSELYGIPWHVCPTVALHQEAWLVRDAEAVERWPIEARARRISM